MTRGRPHKCPYCEATTSVAKGFRYNKGGKVRLRRCKACRRRWTVGPVPGDQLSVMPETEDPEPKPDEFPRVAFAHAQGQVEEPEETAGDDETDLEKDCRTELSLSGEGSPNQNDPGKERKEEAEETFYAQ